MSESDRNLDAERLLRSRTSAYWRPCYIDPSIPRVDLRLPLDCFFNNNRFIAGKGLRVVEAGFLHVAKDLRGHQMPVFQFCTHLDHARKNG